MYPYAASLSVFKSYLVFPACLCVVPCSLLHPSVSKYIPVTAARLCAPLHLNVLKSILVPPACLCVFKSYPVPPGTETLCFLYPLCTSLCPSGVIYLCVSHSRYGPQSVTVLLLQICANLFEVNYTLTLEAMPVSFSILIKTRCS